MTPGGSPDEEKQKVGGEEEEEGGSKISDQRDRRAEGEVKKNEANEKRRAPAKEDTKGEALKSQRPKEQKDKEPLKKAPISSFFGEETFA